MLSVAQSLMHRHGDCFENMTHSRVLMKAHQMAPHPYCRKGAPHWKQAPKVGSMKRFASLVDSEPLQGLIPELGQLSLPLEAVNKIQSWVEPRFAMEAVDDTPRAFQHKEWSETDRKEKIMEYLKRGTIHVQIDDCAVNEISLSDNQPDTKNIVKIESFNKDTKDAAQIDFSMGFPVGSEPHAASAFQIIGTGQEDLDEHMDVYAESRAIRNPLSKLEEMKKQLPAVTERLQDIQGPLANPDSPSSASSSSSSWEGGDESSARRQYARYNGIGQILLWQFLLQCLVNGTRGISWTNQDAYEFQFTYPEVIAKAWGECKPKVKTMTYDKMARGLRSYYKKKVLRKVPNHRYVFQFLDEDIRSICREMQKCNE